MQAGFLGNNLILYLKTIQRDWSKLYKSKIQHTSLDIISHSWPSSQTAINNMEKHWHL